MSLPFGTKVTDRNADPNVVGLVLRLANDAAEYGEEEYVIRWQSGMEELLRRRDLNVVPDPNALRVVPASELKVGDIIYGLLKAEMYRIGFPVMWKAPPLRVTKLHDEDEDLLVILGPDPNTLLEGL